jgi:hypothetical protein
MPQPVGKTSSDGLRELLIAYRRHRLPRSTPPPPWSAPRGWPDGVLDALKAGEAVVVGSDMLLCAFVAAELPRASYDRFCFGGTDFKKSFVLSEGDGLTPYVEWEPGRSPEPVDGLRSRLIANRRRFLSRRPQAGDGDEYLTALESRTPVAVRGWELRATGVDCDDRIYVLEADDALREFVYGVDDAE